MSSIYVIAETINGKNDAAIWPQSFSSLTEALETKIAELKEISPDDEHFLKTATAPFIAMLEVKELAEGDYMDIYYLDMCLTIRHIHLPK